MISSHKYWVSFTYCSIAFKSVKISLCLVGLQFYLHLRFSTLMFFLPLIPILASSLPHRTYGYWLLLVVYSNVWRLMLQLLILHCTSDLHSFTTCPFTRQFQQSFSRCTTCSSFKLLFLTSIHLLSLWLPVHKQLLYLLF